MPVPVRVPEKRGMCSAILDACQALKLTVAQDYENGRGLLIRIVSMLTKAVLRLSEE